MSCLRAYTMKSDAERYKAGALSCFRHGKDLQAEFGERRYPEMNVPSDGSLVQLRPVHHDYLSPTGSAAGMCVGA